MRRPAIAALVLAAASLPALADPLLARARAVQEDGPLYILDMTYSAGETQFLMTIDQSRSEGERVTAFSPDPATLTGDTAKRAENLKKTTAGNVWCSSFAASIPEGARRVSDAGGRAVYRFTPLPGPEAPDNMARAYRHLEGTAEIDTETGQIHRFSMRAPRAFKPAMVAKIDVFTLEAACKPGPDGRTHIDTFNLNLAGSAMMQSFSQSETRRVSNLRPAPISGTGSR